MSVVNGLKLVAPWNVFPFALIRSTRIIPLTLTAYIFTASEVDCPGLGLMKKLSDVPFAFPAVTQPAEDVSETTLPLNFKFPAFEFFAA